MSQLTDNFFELHGVPMPGASSRKARDASTNDIKDLVDIVGSKRAKEIYRDSHFQSQNAFKAWQANENVNLYKFLLLSCFRQYQLNL